jgi:hypothetical protein
MRFLQTLQTDQLPIPSPLDHQLMMCPALHHHPAFNNINDIGLLNGTQPMRNRNGSPALRRRVQRRLDDFLALGVKSTSCFVEEEDLGVAQ